MVLKYKQFESKILRRVTLTGLPLSGMFPWELQWIISRIESLNGDILEIGTHYGSTAREIASAYPNKIVHCVDIVDPSYGVSAADIGRESRNLPNVKLTLADSKTFPYPDGLGMVIIDGDHSWNGIKADTERSIDYFRGRKGCIIWHDYDPTHECMPFLDWFAYHSDFDVRWVQNTSIAVLEL